LIGLGDVSKASSKLSQLKGKAKNILLKEVIFEQRLADAENAESLVLQHITPCPGSNRSASSLATMVLLAHAGYLGQILRI
jgi:hypothetical protein